MRLARDVGLVLAFLAVPWSIVGCPSGDDGPPAAGAAGYDGDGSLPPLLDGGGGIPPAPDGASACPTGACNFQTGDGCGEGGTSSCVPLPDGDGGVSASCEPAGTDKTGSPCTQWTDCASGMICAEGKCHKLCCGGDWTGCPVGEHCIRDLEIPSGSANVLTGAELCYPVDECDVLAPSSCPQKGYACFIVDATGATACYPEGLGAAGDPCPCKAGYGCVGDLCRRLCAAVEGGGSPYCPPSEGRCVHFDRDPVGVGECTPSY